VELEAELKQYGVPSSSLKPFSRPADPGLLDYLDLVTSPRSGELLPDGVAESQGKPLLFYINASKLAASAEEQSGEIERLRRRTLACRGQRAYLAVVRQGQLDVRPVSLDEKTPKWEHYESGTGKAITFFSRLALGEYDGKGEPRHADYAFEGMFELLKQAGEQLAGPQGLEKNDVLSLIGRALFFRFLVDRQVVTEERDRSRIAPRASDLYACFDSAENAAATTRWLDETFNGDFLPLSRGGSKAFFREIGTRTGGDVFRHLRAILRGYQAAGGSTYQIPLSLNWSDFDFAHVPVGLLSQVYEAFCWQWEPQTAGATSVYYTPRNIAATLVDEVFDNLPDAHKARVLDPACGGGVFCVLAFRRLYRALWEATGRRPGTRAIRRILNRQLTGFDISESAIRLTALSLYLTAIELDPNPIPPEKLGFDPLRDQVLFNLRRAKVDPKHGPVIGCLGDHVPARFHHHFDIVLSNPPWTGLPKTVGSKKDEEKKKEETRLAALAADFTKVSQKVIKRQSEEELAAAYHNPDKAPDLPILWKSTEWCKPDGRIAMALPARILLKQQGVPKQARDTLFQLVEVTGIINCCNLTDTHVWANMNQPFMLLFARNRRPKAGHTIQFISPQCDVALNKRGQMWIDSKSALPVDVETTFEEPWLWKSLAVGTALDLEVIRKLKASNAVRLGKYWGKKGLDLPSSPGYILSPGNTQNPAPFLSEVPNLEFTDTFGFAVDPDVLLPFGRNEAHRPRSQEVYRAPLVLVKESPGIDREEGWSLLSLSDVAYSGSFYGYSTAGHPESELLARYFHLFTHSIIWSHYALLTSPKFGVERRKFYKGVLDACPIVPLASLSNGLKRTVKRLSAQLIDDTCRKSGVFSEIDTFFGTLYGLDQLDLEVVRDTLEVSLPYAKSRERACQVASAREQRTFKDRLARLLRPFFRAVGQEPVVELERPPDPRLRETVPFGVLAIGKRGQKLPEAGGFFRESVVPLAIETGQTLILQESREGLLVAILNQYRYWTPSRARLLAAEILRNHMAPFEG